MASSFQTTSNLGSYTSSYNSSSNYNANNASNYNTSGGGGGGYKSSPNYDPLRVETRTYNYSASSNTGATGGGGNVFDTDALLGDLKANHQVRLSLSGLRKKGIWWLDGPELTRLIWQIVWVPSPPHCLKDVFGQLGRLLALCVSRAGRV